jgi:leucyl/phenylalanyl-tRNA---protein transferase
MLMSSRARAHIWPLVSRAANSGVEPFSADLPLRETPRRMATRWILGLAYALQPQRIATVPHLLFWTAVDLVRGGTDVPDQNRTRSHPDTFAGTVRALTPDSYLAAVRAGFFAWAHCGPLKWWTRRSRSVLFFENAHVTRRLARQIRSGKYTFTFDTAFDRVVRHCGEPRCYNWHNLTWLTPRFMQFFSRLHRLGHAHSFEVWNADGELAGGGFGVAVGRVFVGESMFSLETDTSKLACAVLYPHLEKWGFVMVDARDSTPALEKAGYQEIPRAKFEEIMREHAQGLVPAGPWVVDPILLQDTYGPPVTNR